MLLYVLICLCLALVGIAGMQLMYMFYLDRLDRERKKRLHELENRCKYLRQRLAAAEERIGEQDDILDAFYDGSDQEVWADVIEEGGP